MAGSAILAAGGVADAGESPVHVPDGDVAALAAAIEAANASSVPDTFQIILAENGHYELTEPLGEEAGLPTIAPQVFLFLDGRGATIERSDAPGTPAFRLLHVVAYTELKELTLRNGDAGPGADGGAVLAEDSGLELFRCVLEGNRAGGAGGAVAATGFQELFAQEVAFRNNEAGRGGAVDARAFEGAGCTFEGNLATAGSGGGVLLRPPTSIFPPRALGSCHFIDNVAQLDGGGLRVEGGCFQFLQACTFVGNVAIEGSGGGASMAGPTKGSCETPSFTECAFVGNAAGGDGGGLHLDGGATPVRLVRSLLAENVAGAHGGGLAASDSGIIARNTTVSGNEAGASGGGVSLAGSATLEAIAMTVQGNVAAGGAPGLDLAGAAAASLTHTIVSGADSGPLVVGAYVDDGWNIVEDGSGLTSPTSFAADPRLEPLADNGGSTMTHGLGCDSPARDAGDCVTLGLDVDQRGSPRPGGVACDIGAFEVRLPGLDLDCDGVVGLGDVLLVLEAWGPCDACLEDVDGDGAVGFSDLLALLASYEL